MSFWVIVAWLCGLTAVVLAVSQVLRAFRARRYNEQVDLYYRELEEARQRKLLAVSQEIPALEFARRHTWRPPDPYRMAVYMAPCDGRELRTIIVRLCELSHDRWCTLDGQWLWRGTSVGDKLGRYTHHQISIGHLHWAELLSGKIQLPDGWGQVSDLQLVKAERLHQGPTGLVDATPVPAADRAVL